MSEISWDDEKGKDLAPMPHVLIFIDEVADLMRFKSDTIRIFNKNSIATMNSELTLKEIDSFLWIYGKAKELAI